jgi:guanyl-specific ribonuclease Sa
VLFQGCPAISDACDSAPLGNLGAEHPKLAIAAAITALTAGIGELGDIIAGAYTAFRAAGSVEDAAVPANARSTLEQVRETGRAPAGYKGGGNFLNDGRGGGQVLPKVDASGKPITYREWDVNPYQKGVNRGSQRLVTGSDGSAYYTGDHYQTFTTVPE